MNRPKKTESSMTVKTYSLKTFAETHEFYPNFIKMDIEVHPAFYGPDNDLEPVLKEYFDLGFNTKYVVSTPTARPTLFKETGYKPSEEIKTDGYIIGIYKNVSNDDLIRFACYENEEVFTCKGAPRTAKKVVRSFLMER